MAQQINLLTPILLAPRRYLSALTLLQAAALLLVAFVATALWLQQRDRRATAEQQALLANYAAERQALVVAQAGLPAAPDAATVQQQLQPLLAGNAERRALLASLGGDAGTGPRHAELLALVARTLPASAWLTELRHGPAGVELVGGTLDTAVLRPWLAQLSADPLLDGQTVSALRVERLGAAGAAAQPLLPGATPLEQARMPVWAFRVVSAPAGAASAAGGGR